SVRGSPPADSATPRRRGTAGRRTTAGAASRRSRGCRRCPRRPHAGSRRSSPAESSPTGAAGADRRSSVAARVVDVEMVEAPRRAEAAERVKVFAKAGTLQQRLEAGAALGRQLLLLAVGAEAVRHAADEDLRL